MNKHCSPFILAPIAFLLAMHAAQGMTLGEVQLKSYIGQRFKADIPYRLNADERTPEGCHQLLPSNNDVTFIGSATVQVIPQGDGKSGVVRILGRQAAEEPIVGFALHFECDSINLTRDYNVFLDPAPVVDVPIVSSAATITTTAPTSLEARKSSKAVSTTKEVTLQQLAEKYYPINSAGYERYLNKLKRNNPDFGETDRIPVGSMIVIPPRPKVANAAPKAPSMVSVASEQSHLRLEGDERQPPVMSSGNTKITPEAYVKELEAKVAELSELRKKLQLEIDALDQRLAQSQSPASHVVASAAVAVASAAQVVASAPVVAVKAPEPKPAVPRIKSEQTSWQWPALGILGLLGLGTLWWRRRSSREEGVEEVSESILSALKTNFSPRRAMPTQLSMMHNMNTGFEVVHEDTNSLDQAQYFLAQGDTLRAIELLQQLLKADPLDAERWLMLFRVYRQQGMKSDYIQLANKFRAQTPKPSEDDWELVRSIGFKLAPEHPLFARVEEPKPIVETPVDLAISSLERSTQVSALTASAAAVSETINTRASSSGSMSDVNLIDLLQPKPAPAPAHFVRPTIAEEAVDIQLPPISGIKDPVELSSLEELEFNVEKLEFEGGKVPKE
ncbi:hypothetical protein HQ393_01025 [Chitinibacter bivalviorum]|uniref:FimV N-terminal domain-containing protein n=1 Tax=Chitinibacter bivalviorum TaxID=2739434 RepID=A0A7H9BHB7_9NEIS|nr:hypothetical protein [Chitinibacter bivalviorum]QLG86934.1 hypothetical protein HQ393_01025 [Chitinibacter bivalviorum]